MTAWAMGVLAFLLTFLLHSSLLIGVVWLATRVRVVRDAATEDALWKLAIVGGVVTAGLQLGLGVEPLGGTIALTGDDTATSIARGEASERTLRPRAMPGRATPIVAEPLTSRRDASPAQATPAVAEARRPARRVAAPVVTTPSAGAPLDLRVVAAGMWVLLACVGLARWGAARRRLHALLASRRDVFDSALLSTLARLSRRAGIRVPVRLTASAALPGPVVVGRHEICIPPRAVDDLSPHEQEAMMAHEMAHVRRRDPAWLSAIAVLESVFFFQPLLRIARRRWQDTSEFLCDDWAVQATGRRLVLAQCLARVAGWVRSDDQARLVPGMAHADSALVQRVERLAEPRSRRTRRSLSTVAACLAMLTIVSCGVPSFVADDSQDSWLAALHRALHGHVDEVSETRTMRAAGPAAMTVSWIDDEEEEEEVEDGELTLLVRDGRVVLLVDGRPLPVAGRGRVRIGDNLLVVEDDFVRIHGPSGEAHMTLDRASLWTRREGPDRRHDDERREVERREYERQREREHRDRDHRERERYEREVQEMRKVQEMRERERELHGNEHRERERRAHEMEFELQRALYELEREHQTLAREYERAIHDVEREYERLLHGLEREAEERHEHSLHPFERELDEVEHELHVEHEHALHELHVEWDRTSAELHEQRADVLARRHEFDDEDELDEWLEEWEERYEDFEEEFEDRADELEEAFEDRYDEWIEELEEAYEAVEEEFEDDFEARYEDLEDGFEDRYEEIEDHFEAAFEDLEDAYEEIEEHYEELFEDLDDCDHDCEFRCRDGCTHDDEHDFTGGFWHEFDDFDEFDELAEWGEWAEWGEAWADDDAWADAWVEWEDDWDADWDGDWDDADWADAWAEWGAWDWDAEWHDEDECCDEEPCEEEPCDEPVEPAEPIEDDGVVLFELPAADGREVVRLDVPEPAPARR